MLELRNPHSVEAALAVRPAAVKSVTVNSSSAGDAWDRVIHLAQKNRIPVLAGDRGASHAKRQRRTQRHGRGSERMTSSFATVEPPSPIPLDLLWQDETDGRPGIWLALDQVQDPQNLGAIFRLGGFFGVRGVVMLKDRSASLTSVACDVAAGGAEYVPFSVVPNLAQAMQKARDNDIWVVGTCERAEERLSALDRSRHWLLIVGNEGTGLRRLTRERCDQLVSIPPLGPVPSLNVATATAACLAILTQH
jgi:23S rRNA (guanosine2251-2'-O)-methyltransferase